MDESTRELGKVIKIDQAKIRDHPGEMVRHLVEDTLNAMLDTEGDQRCNAKTLAPIVPKRMVIQ